MAIYALLIFSVLLKWFPAIGAGHHGDLASQLHALVLLTVALGWIGYLSRLVRASMLEVLKENHILTFRAFGMPDRLIALRYELPIAVVPEYRCWGSHWLAAFRRGADGNRLRPAGARQIGV
ncbi:hypothetical protein [Sodalis glossinidius]|uniref:hypothetical protein n=1 Tax=Sodalis glossinidius TaxID=63612 RepID=UPI0003212236|nr:hypothetical protein [Sodalis glossinidius]